MKQAHLITTAALLALSPFVQAVNKHEPAFSRVIVDELEARDADEGTVAAWEASAWYGGDLNKLYLSTCLLSHLTLPTNREVSISVVAVSLKKTRETIKSHRHLHPTGPVRVLFASARP